MTQQSNRHAADADDTGAGQGETLDEGTVVALGCRMAGKPVWARAATHASYDAAGVVDAGRDVTAAEFEQLERDLERAVETVRGD